jgi:stage III sporulation protein AE
LRWKLIFGLIIALGVSLVAVRPGYAVDVDLGQTATSLDLTELNQFIGTLDQDTVRFLPKFDLKSWGATGPRWQVAEIGRQLLRYFFREILFNLHLLGELILLALALAILQNIQPAFENVTVQQMAFGVCFLSIIGIVLNSFKVTFGIAQGAVDTLTGFMRATIPLMFSLIAAAGGVTTTMIVHPLLITAVGVVAGLMNSLVFPLILFAGALSLVNYLNDGFPIAKLANLFRKAALGLMGLAMASFIGLIAIRGFTAGVADSTALRAGKYFTKTFLPAVGGELADTLEMAVGCAAILKSGLGMFGLGVVILIAVFPLIKILTVGIVYNLTGAILQPLGNQRLADALEKVGETFFTLFGALAVIGLMFFIAIAILVGLSNYGAR